MNRLFYLIGHPVFHSKSPIMYNTLYRSLGFEWHYEAKDIPENERARDFIEKGVYRALNVTTPYKKLAAVCARKKEASVLLSGGANLIVNADNQLLAYNLDGVGCVDFLMRQEVNFANAAIVVCGTGPTALSIMHAVAQAGAAQITLLGRSLQRTTQTLKTYLNIAQELAMTSDDGSEQDSLARIQDDVAFEASDYSSSRRALTEAEVIIDATSLGMNPNDPAPFDTTVLQSSQTVCDIVYGHKTTALVQAAKKAGCQTFDGSGMLVSQAVATAFIQAEFSKVEIPLSATEVYDLMFEAAFGTL